MGVVKDEAGRGQAECGDAETAVSEARGLGRRALRDPEGQVHKPGERDEQVCADRRC
ncbi:hypothetical protein [Streptomyces cinereoruber]|uniref:hypothetical protein n=1 Tax=Streptomyces cinereoruber TaxID=67260 RepID=UPI0036329314